MFCGMRAPQHVYGCTVKNTLDVAVEVTVVYHRINPEANEPAVVTLAAGAEHVFEQKTYAVDTASFSYTIDAVRVKAEAEAEVVAPFKDVTSPVKTYLFTVGGTAAAPAIEQTKL